MGSVTARITSAATGPRAGGIPGNRPAGTPAAVKPLRWVVALALSALTATAASDPHFACTPVVVADRTVTFQLDWPKDAKVELVARGEGRHSDFPRPVYPMTRAPDGIWRVTVGPLLPGVHLYRFRVDGAEIVDPCNPSVQAFFRGPWSKVEVPDPAPVPWTPRSGVPQGRVEVRHFGDQTVGGTRPVHVYLPPGYREGTGPGLPVLYLLHGAEYNEADWLGNGLLSTLLDNLIASGRARPMIVVMPIGYSRLPIDDATAQRDEYGQWSAQILQGLVPWVDRTYGTAAGREHRAVAGFSMGGHQALRLGLGHPELFAWVGAFSTGAGGLANYPEYAPTFAAGAPKPELVLIGCGAGDKLNPEARQTYEKLKAGGLRTEWREIDGRHTWRVWRQCLAELLERTFTQS